MERDMIMKPWPNKYSATVLWGNQKFPITGKSIFHHGVDVPMPVGTPLIAGADGEVVEKTDRTGTGITLTIKHAEDLFAIYHHLQEPSKFNIGDTVKAGEVVAYSGKTGRTTGPHIHFELRKSPTNYTESLDPLKYIARRAIK
jgi:murein DD-endopeptidase MepM/ murein hydrolase activator NlpD